MLASVAPLAWVNSNAWNVMEVSCAALPGDLSRRGGPECKTAGLGPAACSGRNNAGRSYFLMLASLRSSVPASAAPGMRVPSMKNTAGVPVMFMLWPSARLSSTGVLQVPLPVRATLFSIQSRHALVRSAAHQTCFALISESGDSTGYRKV